MYINSLGMRDVEKLHGVKKAGGIVSGSRNFSEILQKAAGTSGREQAVTKETQACCETCSQTGRLVRQMALQNLYLQGGLGTMAGLSSGGLGNLSSGSLGVWRSLASGGLGNLSSGGLGVWRSLASGGLGNLSSGSLGALAAYQGLAGLFSGV